MNSPLSNPTPSHASTTRNCAKKRKNGYSAKKRTIRSTRRRTATCGPPRDIYDGAVHPAGVFVLGNGKNSSLNAPASPVIDFSVRYRSAQVRFPNFSYARKIGILFATVLSLGKKAGLLGGGNIFISSIQRRRFVALRAGRRQIMSMRRKMVKLRRTSLQSPPFRRTLQQQSISHSSRGSRNP